MSHDERVLVTLRGLADQLFNPGSKSSSWDEALIRVRDFAGFQRLAYDYRVGETWDWFKRSDFFENDSSEYNELKRLAFEPGLGSWISLKIHLFPDRDPYAEFIRDEEIMFGGVLDHPAKAGSIYRELVAYPRTAENIPSWMREKITEAGEEVPVFDSETSEIIIGENRYPFTEPGL
ncbi:hypothetical protein [Spelaeicoccus albus]|uniref:Uncharacterized protein n=1 Tax=Spelaeicoccus albus TaxID=1280376 RepID=A0A7Z0A9D4_9MICO|nr:hypothetical protein [Spelaeicoccus albus]NYI66809.1 hypothetical protein [Spelaeicoccus albus]